MSQPLRSLMAALFGAFCLIAGSVVFLPTQTESRAAPGSNPFDMLEQVGSSMVTTFQQLRGRNTHGTLCADSKALKDIRASIDTQRVTLGRRSGDSTPNYHLTTRLIACMVSPIKGDGAADKPGYVIYYGQKMVDAISKTMLAVLSALALLATVLYGIRLVLGFAHEIQSAGLMLVFKVAMIMLAIGMSPTLYMASVNTMNQAAGDIAKAIKVDMCPEIDAAASKFKTADGDRTFLLPWVKLDCAVESIATVMLDSSNSAMGTMVTAFISANMGKGLAVAFFSTAATLFNALNLAVFIVVLANLAIVLMFMVAPMTWVCIMFKPTLKYFQSWLRVTIGFILQPIILALFCMMLIGAFEEVMCKEKFSVVASFNAIKHDRVGVRYVYKDPVVTSNAQAGTDYGPLWCTREKMQEAMAQDMVAALTDEIIKNKSIEGTTDFDFVSKIKGIGSSVVGKVTEIKQSVIDGLLTTAGFQTTSLNVPQIKDTLVPKLGLPFLSFLAAFAMMFILYAFLQQLPNFINQLTSSAVTSGNLNQIQPQSKAKESMNVMDSATGNFNMGGMGAFGNIRQGLSGFGTSGGDKK